MDLLDAINEQQCCGGVADEERETTDATAYDPAEEMVRITGASVGNSFELVSHQVSSGLQKVGIDIVGAIQQIDNLFVVLRHWREDTEKKFSVLFDKSK